jgi:tRNA (mo5U34)-methyltransferase
METEDPPLELAILHHPWLQSLRLRPGLLTAGAKGEPQLLAEEAALFDSLNLAGAHVLEIGAANGYFSFAAMRRGAAHVVTTDHLAWSLPGMQAQSATALAARALQLPAQLMVLDPRALTPEFGSFHVVLATGFCEQLFNPILALQGLSAVTSRVLMLETAQDALLEQRPMMTATLLTMPYNAMVAGWAPNPRAMLQLLQHVGFDRVLYRPHPEMGGTRGIYAALKPEAPEGLLEGFSAPWTSLTHPRG